jgi:hypothetical protein
MGVWTTLFAGLRALFRKHRAEQELDDELHDYLHKSISEKLRSGLK